MTHHPPLIVISGSIGSGKGTIVHALVHELSLHWVPTHTTRTMRSDDHSMSKRIFDTEATFLRHVARNELVEMTKIADHYYGLLRSDLDHALAHNHPAIVELTVDGGIKVAKEYPNSYLVFIQADEKSRHDRISHRHMEKSEIETRMEQSKKEEKLAHEHYDVLVENPEDHPELAIDTVKDLITKHFPELDQK